MQSNVAKRVARGFGANLYGQVVVAVIQLAGVPILLHFWGAQLYGEWLILSALPAYLSMTDLGFAQSAANDMTQHMSRGDHEEALSVFQSTAILIALLSMVGIIGVVAVLSVAPLSDWLSLPMLSPHDTALILGFLSAEVLIKLNDGTLDAAFRANGGYALHAAIYFTTLLIQYIALWLVAGAGGGPVGGAAAFVGIRILVTPAVALLMRHRYPWMTIGFSHARLSQVYRLIRPAFANIVFPFGRALNIQGMTLAVGAVLGPFAVVVFSTLRTLARLALQGVLTISHAAEPEMAAAYGSMNTKLLRRLYIHITQLSVVLAIAAAVILFWVGDWILRHWTHGAVPMDSALFVWLLLSSVMGTLWYGGLVVLKAANRHMRAAVVFMLAAALSVLVAYALMRVTGFVSSVGVALFVLDIIMLVYVQVAAKEIYGDSVALQLFNPRFLRQPGSF